MTQFPIGPAVAPLLLAAGLLASASVSAAPIVTFAQGVPDPAAPCTTGVGLDFGRCIVPEGVRNARGTWLGGVAGAAFEEFVPKVGQAKPSSSLFEGAGTLSSIVAPNADFYSDPLFAGQFPGRFNTTGGGGSAGWWFEFASGVITIEFNSPVEAFAFYLTDLGDEGGSASVGLFNGQTQVGSSLPVVGQASDGRPIPLPADNASVLFFGVTSDGNPFDRVTLTIGGQRNDFAGLDSLIVGNIAGGDRPLPTPGSLALAGLGLLGLLGLRRLSTSR